MAEPLRLMETFRSLFYTPIYVGLAGGFWETEGLAVQFATTPPEFAHPLGALNAGAADIVQSGIMRSIIAADWGAETVPLHFAEINARDGFFLLRRPPPGETAGPPPPDFRPEFQWETLRGARLLPVGFSPMPWASLQWAMRRNGVEPSEMSLQLGLSMDEALAAFRRGEADYIHAPQPAAEVLLAGGEAQLAAALGPENGHLAYSSFAATHYFLENRGDLAGRFTAGFARALGWLAGRRDTDGGAAEVAAAVAGFFPETPPEVAAAAIARYQAQRNWPETPHLGRPEYAAQHDILLAAGLCRQRHPYEKIVRADLTAE